MSTLQIDRKPNGVVTLTLNRPEVHNAFDEALISAMRDALEALAADNSARALVLTGAGTSFSAGADLNWMRSMLDASEADNEQDALQLAQMLRALNYLPLPTIARVNGAALGGGLGLVACCDLAVTVDSARFGLTETRLGLAPAIISPYVGRKIGESAARRYFLTAERFDSEEALRLGLVHRVTSRDALDAAVDNLLTELRRGGPSAVRESKRLAFHAAGHDEQRQLEMDRHTAKLIARLRTSEEGQEGMRAFLDKRPAGWIKTDSD